MTTSSPGSDKKAAAIGVLASFDSVEKNRALADCFNQLCDTDTNLLTSFQFLFTGGTFQRLLTGWEASDGQWRTPFLSSPVRELILAHSTCLPERKKGGVTVLANYLVSRQISIIWAFFDPVEAHWLNPENLALMRLCDVWRVKRLRNSGSLLEWFATEADRDSTRNKQPVPPPLKLAQEISMEAKPWKPKQSEANSPPAKRQGPYELSCVEPGQHREPAIALIAHDEMKPRMVDFAVQYERELGLFNPIFATGTTGKEVAEAAPTLHDKIWRFHSGPKGGDIQIATEILLGRCDVVIFFLDPLRPHPHADDIRVVLSACMVENNVRILTNDVEARDWMEEVVGKGHLKEAIQRIRQRTA